MEADGKPRCGRVLVHYRSTCIISLKRSGVSKKTKCVFMCFSETGMHVSDRLDCSPTSYNLIHSWCHCRGCDTCNLAVPQLNRTKQKGDKSCSMLHTKLRRCLLDRCKAVCPVQLENVSRNLRKEVVRIRL